MRTKRSGRCPLSSADLICRLCSWWKKKDKEAHHGTSTISDDVLRETQVKFNEYDSNGNGTIDRDELAGLLRALDLTQYIPEMEDLEDDDAYKIVVHTGSHPEAGTDSKVTITLYGENGDSGPRVLTTARNRTFERGQISTLKVTSTDLGKLTKVKIGHDNSGTEGGTPGKGWFLDKVVVSKKGDSEMFGAERWLDKVNAPDKQTEVTLTPGMPPKKKEKKVQKDDKVMYVNPVYGPGGDTAPPELDKLDLGNPNRRVTVISAHDLINADMFDKSDPYCVVYFNGKKVGKTSTIDNTTFPRWNEDFVIQLPESGEGLLRCELYDHDMFGGDDPLGTVEFKLGGADNPRALLQTADYSFPDDKFTGHLTLRVDHAAQRFATEPQHEFKDKWMKGMTYREHREKHVFEEWTRMYIMAACANLILFGVIMFFTAWWLETCETYPYLSNMYLYLAPFQILSCAAGFYGAFRVKADVEAETMSTTGGDTQQDEDDGLQTTGQRILEVFNMLCVLMFVVWSVIVAESYVLEELQYNEAKAGSGGIAEDCEDQHGTLTSLSILGYLSMFLLILLVYSCTKIVSFFEVLQTMAEFLAGFLVVFGIVVTVICAFVVKQVICLYQSPTGGDEWPDEAWMFITLGIFGMCTVAVSFLGFAAAYQESMLNLLIHALALVGLAVFGTICIIYIGSTSITDFIVKENCRPMLTTLSESWFWEEFEVRKYDGRGMSRNSTGMWNPVQGPSEAPGCFPKSLTAFYWDGNAVNADGNYGYLEPTTGEPYDATGTKVLYGCLNEPACQVVADKLSAYDVTIGVLTGWLMLVIVGSIWSSLYLRKETSMVGHVLIHANAKLIFWIMKITLLVFCIGAPFMFTGGECGMVHDFDADGVNIESTRAIVANVTYAAPPNCFDGVQNGDETDVDCGGSLNGCDGCAAMEGCLVNDDCLGDAVSCVSDDIASSATWDGPAAGTCFYTSMIMCQNGVQDNDETDADCGGPDCDASCGAGQGCETQGDCGTNDKGDDLFCGPPPGSASSICFDCLDGVQNGDETGTDCGGSNCAKCQDGDVCDSDANACSCLLDTDCLSGICFTMADNSQRCVSGTNNRLDAGYETDVDCGGSSGRGCMPDEICAVGDDCLSGLCTDLVCAVPGQDCSNGELDGFETCLDGGGYQCRSLEVPRLCSVADCSWHHNAALNTCAGETCDGCGDGVPTTNGVPDGYVQGTPWAPSTTCPDGCTLTNPVPVGHPSTTCQSHADCIYGAWCTSSNSTAAGLVGHCFSCENDLRDGDEVATDCGGQYCDRCEDHSQCLVDSDCQSNLCYSFDITSGWGVCASRSNNERDGGETGVDCGGAALIEGRACGVGEGCLNDEDCITESCGCDQDRAEGGPGTKCDQSADDTNADGNAGVCVAQSSETCQNGQLDAGETDIDCGGTSCAAQGFLCGSGSACEYSVDCDSGHCQDGLCADCNNGLLDGDETDVDCGGSNCNACGDQQACNADADCASGMCEGTVGDSVCASCFNGFMDGAETGIDCGGQCARACPLRQCRADGAACGPFTPGGSPQASACMLPSQVAAAQVGGFPPGMQSCVPAGCLVASDCASSYCNLGTMECDQRTPAQQCSDGVLTTTATHGETDVDCGGTCALAGLLCNAGQSCDNPSDCVSGDCSGADGVDGNADGVCGGGCNNGVQDGSETDVDCGGECGKCMSNLACSTDSDCVVSGVCRESLCVSACYEDDDCMNGSCLPPDDPNNPTANRPEAERLGICVSCYNNIADWGEAGVDCGAACGNFCPLGSSCNVDLDCHSGQCVDSVCSSVAPANPLCANGDRDQDETGTDCGGVCLLEDKQCGDGAGCESDDDCISGTCAWDGAAGTCISCSDGVQNGDETDVDCGGSSCQRCRSAQPDGTPAQMCAGDSDCVEGMCRRGGVGGMTRMCMSCFNGVRDYLEGDADCGTGCPRLCPNTEPPTSCFTDGDCVSGYCRQGGRGSPGTSDPTGSCVEVDTALCTDGALTAELETGVDCGGDCRALGFLCGANEGCMDDNDCAGGVCDDSGTDNNNDLGACVSCDDGAQNGDETGVDCGGAECGSCPDGVGCTGDSDCQSGQCTSGTCTSCDNGLLDGDETGTDCGGATCRALSLCGPGDGCADDNDCRTGSCESSVCVDVPTGEQLCASTGTGTSCGGAACLALGLQCANGDGCEQGADCLSGFCDDGLCVSCADGTQNNGETDVDCGGPNCASCVPAGGDCADSSDPTTCSVPAQNCVSDSDCSSGECFTPTTVDSGLGMSTCVSFHNGVRDGAEGGVDCGSLAPSLCATDTACRSNADCSTGLCTDNVCAVPEPSAVNLPCVEGNAACCNGVQDGAETDVDCGGEFCRNHGFQCSAGTTTALPGTCLVPLDCDSGACSLPSNSRNLPCLLNTDCSQGYEMANTQCQFSPELPPGAGECPDTGLDCSDAVPCAGDPAPACRPFLGVCVGQCSSCNDGRTNGAETDVDCGGGAGSCDGCNVGGTCGCAATSAGVCTRHVDCSAGLSCYAPGGDTDSARCIRPASIALAAADETVLSSPGASVLGKLSVSGAAPSGADTMCSVRAQVSATGGVNVALPNFEVRLALLAGCESTSVVASEAMAIIEGPYDCVSSVMSEVRLDTTCTSAWADGANAAEVEAGGVVEATIAVEISVDDPACEVPADSASGSLDVRLVGQPQLTVTGVAIASDSVYGAELSSDPLERLGSLAVEGVVVTGGIESCGSDGGMGTVGAACESVPHPDGIPGGCCDHDSPYSVSPGMQCQQIIAAHLPCNMVIPNALNMPRDCAESCGRCPPAPPPTPVNSYTTGCGPAGGCSGVDAGLFSLTVPLGLSDAGGENVELRLRHPEYEDTKVIVPVQNGQIEVGHVMMVKKVDAEAPATITGSCLDLFSTDDVRDETNHAVVDASLIAGHVVFPAVEPPTAYADEYPDNADGVYRFADVPGGTYTVQCAVNGITAERYVVSAGANTPAAFDAVALPKPETISGQVMVTVGWQVLAAGSDSPENGPDLDLSGLFQATEDEGATEGQECHTFVTVPDCGDMSVARDYRDPVDGTTACPDAGDASCSLDVLDGPIALALPDPAASGNLLSKIPTEAIILTQVRAAVYTFYVQYNHEFLYADVDSGTPEAVAAAEVVEVSGDVFAGSARVGHVVSRFEVPGTQPYIRLFCVDATSGTPTVHPIVTNQRSTTPPLLCESCPC